MKLYLAFVLLLLSGCSNGIDTQRTATGDHDVRPGFALVPKPDPKVFSQTSTLEKWRNPFLFVHPDGVEVISMGRHDEGPHLSVAEIEDVLMSLPVEAWPLGRAVAVQENALGSGPEQTKNVMALKAMLESHDIAINGVPTA